MYHLREASHQSLFRLPNNSAVLLQSSQNLNSGILASAAVFIREGKTRDRRIRGGYQQRFQPHGRIAGECQKCSTHIELCRERLVVIEGVLNERHSFIEPARHVWNAIPFLIVIVNNSFLSTSWNYWHNTSFFIVIRRCPRPQWKEQIRALPLPAKKGKIFVKVIITTTASPKYQI